MIPCRNTLPRRGPVRPVAAAVALVAAAGLTGAVHAQMRFPSVAKADAPPPPPFGALPDSVVQPYGAYAIGTYTLNAISPSIPPVLRSRLADLRVGQRGLGHYGAGAWSPSEYAAGIGGGASADGSANRFGAFVNMGSDRGERSSTERETGFEFDHRSATLGVDYRVTPGFIVGAALSAGRGDATLSAVRTPAGELRPGTLDADTRDASLYATWFSPQFYVDGYLSRSDLSYDLRRNIVFGSLARVARGGPDGRQETASLSAGRDFPLGATTLTPYARAEYVKLSIDGFSESGSGGFDTRVGAQSVKSLQTALGARAIHAISTGFGVVVPQASVEWIREHKRDARQLVAEPLGAQLGALPRVFTDLPDRDFFSLSIGATVQLPYGISGFIHYDRWIGVEHVDRDSVKLGFKIEF